jgi:DNA transformation protein
VLGLRAANLMAVTPTFRVFVLEQLGRVLPRVTGRSMFGGIGIYAGDVFFALIAQDTLYFKVDDATRREYEALGLEPFRPYGKDTKPMQYYQVPEDVLEDPDALRPWVEKALAVARASGRRGRRRRG